LIDTEEVWGIIEMRGNRGGNMVNNERKEEKAE